MPSKLFVILSFFFIPTILFNNSIAGPRKFSMYLITLQDRSQGIPTTSEDILLLLIWYIVNSSLKFLHAEPYKYIVKIKNEIMPTRTWKNCIE